MTIESQFRMPAEWEPHEAVLLTWPHNDRTWPGRLEAVQDVYVRFIAEIAESEAAWVVVRGEEEQTEVTRRLTLANVSCRNVRFFIHPNNDAWIRDYGPIYVKDHLTGARLVTDWVFNGWGSKYQDTENYRNDDLVPLHVAKETGVLYRHVPFVLEGGSIDVNGRGTLLTSRSCLLNENRNVESTQSRIEGILRQNLGVTKIVWVDDGIAGDDTDGHIDDTVRFVNESTVVCAYEDDPQDENHAPLKAAYESLRHATDQDGRPLRVVKIPMPEPVYDAGRERLPASYANFLIMNTKVLVPVFGGAKDAEAIAILRELFPTRKIVGIDGRDLVLGFGSLHCLSQQVPA